MSCCYLRFGFFGTKLFPFLLMLSLSELITSQTCNNFQCCLHPAFSAPPALSSSTWLFLCVYFCLVLVGFWVLLWVFCIILFSAKSILFLHPLKLNPSLLSIHPFIYSFLCLSLPPLKSCLNSLVEVDFFCDSDLQTSASLMSLLICLFLQK